MLRHGPILAYAVAALRAGAEAAFNRTVAGRGPSAVCRHITVLRSTDFPWGLAAPTLP